MFREFFLFELKFRFKSPSTWIYFLMWVLFSFLCVASENFGPVETRTASSCSTVRTPTRSMTFIAACSA